jgi:hypothetical protein
MAQRASTCPVPPQSLAERLLAEGPLHTIVAAAAAEGFAISAKTALRWAIAGTNGARLDSIRVGGRRMTTRAAMRRFIVAQQRHDAPVSRCTLTPVEVDRLLAAHGLGREGGAA